MRVTRGQMAVYAVVAILILACTPAQVRLDAARGAQGPTLNHVTPKRDSSGPIPTRLEWTPVKGADHYSVGVWSEVDVLIWKMTNIQNNAVDWPKDIVVDSGTYFWSVMAFRNGQPMADSGLAAFIVVR